MKEYIIKENDFLSKESFRKIIQTDNIGVTILMISYNNPVQIKQRLGREVIPTITDHPSWNFQLIVVDNSDDDRTIDFQKLRNLNLNFIYLRYGHNLMYGPSINLVIEHAHYAYLVYLCSNHGRIFSTSWIDDLIAPLIDYPRTAMAGSLYPSCIPSSMGFPDSLPRKHIQGGIFSAKTDILRSYKYTQDPRWIHDGSDIYQSYQLLNAGYDLFDVLSIKSVWKSRLSNPEKWKYVHDESA